MSEHLEEPREYIGRNYWTRLTYTVGGHVRHVHSCPICHGEFFCAYKCTLEPDLECDDGTPKGATVCCSRECARENDEILDEAIGNIGQCETAYYIPPEQLAFPGLEGEEAGV